MILLRAPLCTYFSIQLLPRSKHIPVCSMQTYQLMLHKVLFVPAYVMMACGCGRGGEGDCHIAAIILDLRTRWRSVVIFTPWPRNV